MHIDVSSLARPAGKHLGLAAGVERLELLVRAPNHAHAGATAGLDARDGVLKDEALLGLDGLFALGKRGVDGVEGQEEDVGQGLAAAGLQPLVVAQDAALVGEDGEELRQVVRLELEVGQVGARGEGNVHGLLLMLLRLGEVGEQLGDAGEGPGGREALLVKGDDAGQVLLGRELEVGPFEEDLGGRGAGAALELGLDVPGELGAGLRVLLEDDVDALRVDVLGVEQEAVHVEEAGSHGREAVHVCVW